LAPPKALTEHVMAKMSGLLSPSPRLVFAKLFSINLFVGTLSLSVCHQFGLNPFNTERSLDSWFMQVGGHQVCMFLCGVVFLAISMLAAGLILNIEEMLSLKRNKYLQVAAISLFSLVILFLFGAEFTLGIGALWLLGALVGGIAATETVWRMSVQPG
jgi:hypothetical protein